jgi:hypothetical protein
MFLINAVRKLSHRSTRTHAEFPMPTAQAEFRRADVSPVPWPEPARQFSAFTKP